jgi:conjugal transfer pilus assembly protein TraK
MRIVATALLVMSMAHADADTLPVPQNKMTVVKAATPAALAVGATTLPGPSKPVIARRKAKPSTNLPGVGEISGSPAVFNTSVIHVSADRNEVAYVSSAFSNRISTPFQHPMLLGSLPNGYNDETIKVVGSSMYFPPVDQTLAIFMTGNNPGDQVISLTLEPKDVPSQVVSLMLDGGGEGGASDRKSDATPNSYTDALVSKFRMVAIGKTPQGFSTAVISPTIARVGDLIIIPERRLSGSKLDIYCYRVENAGKSIVELAETSFYDNGVRGVAIYPNLKLEPNESTYVFVASDKTISDTSPSVDDGNKK